jgi:hypothetical protein
MPDYLHSCFISYSHFPEPDSLEAGQHFELEFVEAFEKKVNMFRQIALLTYRDVQLSSNPGVHYPDELARKMCRSICMIAVLTREYMESKWCRAEWRAMEQLEKARKIGKRDGCIIPILRRGDLKQAQEFCGTRQFLDFSKVVAPKAQLDTVWGRQRMLDIGAQVARLAAHVSPVDCAGFSIDVGEEVTKPAFDDPSPLRRSR